MERAVIVGAVRTAIGNFGGALKEVPAVELAARVVEEALRRAGLEPGQVNEVIMGHVLQAGVGMNLARQAAVKAGIPIKVSSYTVNKVCGSGLKAVTLAAQAIACGDAEVVVAGGAESMSGAPYLLQGGRWGYRMGHGELRDALLVDGLTCAMTDSCHMGVTAENIAARYGIGREAQDAFAACSQQRAEQAIAAGRFTEEIVPVAVPGKKKGEVQQFATDEFARAGTTAEGLAKLRPAFQKQGTVTAGNASGINDGAAALVLVSERLAAQLGREPLGTLRAYAAAGVPPEVMGLGPIPAVRQALARAGWNKDEVELFELNEAFAVQSLAVLQELEVASNRVNVNGGAIALGHPIGASGARILTTLLYEMRRRAAHRGLAALCIGGGQGIAALVER